MRLRRADPHTLAGAYALDALTGPDQAAFERHLGSCDACHQESGGLREAGAHLAAAVAATPPPGLRDRVLAAVARTRQMPPADADAAGPARWRRGKWRRVMPRLAAVLAGVCLLGALVLGGLALAAQHRLGEMRDHSRQIAAVLNAPDATMMTARAARGGTATVVMSHADHALVLTTARLPSLPAADAYQVWLMGPGGVRSAGMLPAPQRGMTAPVIVSGLAAGDKVGLTVEPAGGASRPTAPPVLMLALPS